MKTNCALLVDFGSTFTKVTAVDLARAEVIGRSQSPSTVGSDVRYGLLKALDGLAGQTNLFGSMPVALEMLQEYFVRASSSAAGGLRMVVIGLVPGLTVQAANQAALGAGAKLVGSFSFKLHEKEIAEIQQLAPDMILLTGGTNGGDRATILHNAAQLAAASLSVPIIAAGNAVVAQEVEDILRKLGKDVRLAENVMPKSGELSVESAREQIRRVFMEHITEAKGLDKVREWLPVVLPTPMAVLEGVRIGAEGSGALPGWGDMLVVDVGGATTDVHSIGYGKPAGENIIGQGLDEAYAKRTVEGDLGIRFNAGTILQRVGLEAFAETFHHAFPQFVVAPNEIHSYIEQISRDTERVPDAPWHSAVDASLARCAVELAVERHVGRRECYFAREGTTWLHYGKDLRDVHTLIGTGGVFLYNPYAAFILDHAPAETELREVLRPRQPRCFTDASYLLYAVGLLAEQYPEVALKIFAAHMQPVKMH